MAMVVMLMLVLMIVCMRICDLKSVWQLMQASLTQHCTCTDHMHTRARLHEAKLQCLAQTLSIMDHHETFVFERRQPVQDSGNALAV